MSSMERNKGKLIPVGVDTEHFTEDDWDTYSDNGFITIDGEVYDVEYEIEGETDDNGFAYVQINEDGTIDFHTLHFNGGACLSEVIEHALNKEKKKC